MKLIKKLFYGNEKRNFVVLVLVLITLLLYLYKHKEDLKQVTVALPAARNVVNPFSNDIFFIATQNLKAKEACAIESTARINPDKRIFVLFSTDIQNSAELNVLREYSNILFARIKPRKLARHTSLKSLIETYEQLRKNADVLKILAMKNYGGIYLDLDIIAVKPFRGLVDNFVVRYGENEFSFGVMGVSLSYLGQRFLHNVTRQLIWKIRENNDKNGDIGNFTGAEILKRTLEKYCTTSYAPDMSSSTCPGLQIYNHERFVMKYTDVEKYFYGGKLEYVLQKNVYIVSMKYDHRIAGTLKAHYISMAAKYCPLLFKEFVDL